MNLYYSLVTGAVAGACVAFSVCMIKDLTIADTLYRMFIVGIGGAWIGFLLSWLNMILPRLDKHQNQQREHHI